MGYYGEYVRIEFASADATTAAPLTLYDSNNTARTLAENERLLLDHLTYHLADAVLYAEIFDDVDADGAINAGSRLAILSVNGSEVDGGMEGQAGGIGRVPEIIAAVAGVVRVAGCGRIVKGRTETEGGRPGWRESLVPGA